EHYLAGGTASSDFPMVAGGVQSSYAGGIADGYVVRLGNNGNTILSSTFYGSDQYDQFYFIEVDNDNQIYLFGQTYAPGSSMIINAGYGVANSGNLLTKMTPDLSSVTWSTVIGTGDGKPNLSPSAFLVDNCNRVYLSGWGIIQVSGNALNPNQNLHTMSGLPTTSDAFDNACSTGDFYMAIFDENMQNLEYATFFGGGSSSEHVDGGTSRFDRKGVIYQSVCAGCGGYDDFPIQPGNAWSALNNSSCNNGVYKFDFQLPLTVADFNYSPQLCAGNSIQFIQESAFATSYHWDFGDGQSSTLPSPQHVYADGGTYVVTLLVENPTTCNGIDSLQQTLVIGSQETTQQNAVNLCQGVQIQIGPTDINPNATYSWSPADGLTNPSSPITTFNGDSSEVYTLAISNNGCIEYWIQPVEVIDVQIEAPADTTLCDNAGLVLSAEDFSPETAIIWSLSPDGNNPLNDDVNDPSIEVQPNIP
ncbi:MAG: PKD domain-containing protein, partial [Flavobacteriales bacterium]